MGYPLWWPAMRDRIDYWLSGRAHARKQPRVWLRPFCWLLGGHTFGLAFGDDNRCLTCGKRDESEWPPQPDPDPDMSDDRCTWCGGAGETVWTGPTRSTRAQTTRMAAMRGGSGKRSDQRIF
jgi:hypothetical protein